MQSFRICVQKRIRYCITLLKVRFWSRLGDCYVWRKLIFPDAKLFASATAILMCWLLMSSAAVAQGVDKSGTKNNRFLDKFHTKGSKFVMGGAERIDSFFAHDERATFEQNNTYVRLRLDADYIEGTNWDIGPKLKLSLRLPGLGDRVRLVVNDDEESDEGVGQGDSRDDSNIALRWVGKQTNRFGLSLDVGLRINDSDLAEFVRLNAGKKYPLGKKWSGNTTNRLYYYSDTGFRDDLRQYFDRPMGTAKKVLFRSRSRVQYFEEEDENPVWEQKITLFHQISNKHSIAYEALVGNVVADDSPYDADEILVPPQTEYKRAQIRIRYRRNIWRPWLFMEFWPIVAWPEERDYETTYAARFRLEMYFGSIRKNPSTLSE